MRIKLNRKLLAPDTCPDLCWLYVDTSKIMFIKELKVKVKSVLKEKNDIELCFDGIPFLDEDEINAINDGEEISVIRNERNSIAEPQIIETNIPETLTSYMNSTSNNLSNGNLKFIPENGNNSSASSIIINSEKKKRKRTHKKKKKQENDHVEIVNNSNQSEIPCLSSDKGNGDHKRFKLEEEKNAKSFDGSESVSSIEEILHVTRDVYRCSVPPMPNEKVSSITSHVWKHEFKGPNTKFNGGVPVFIRGQTNKPSLDVIQSNTFVDNKMQQTSVNEDCDMLIVDWKNMSTVKVTSLSELKKYDLLQFKTLALNEHCEPQMSSVITSRLINIDSDTLYIEVLSGIKEFMTLNPKFRIEDEEEEINTCRNVRYSDLCDLVKLI